MLSDVPVLLIAMLESLMLPRPVFTVRSTLNSTGCLLVGALLTTVWSDVVNYGVRLLTASVDRRVVRQVVQALNGLLLGDGRVWAVFGVLTMSVTVTMTVMMMP